MTRRRAHIAIEYLVNGLPAENRRPLASAVILTTAFVCLMGAWITGAETWRQYVGEIETMSAFPVPKWWVSIFTPYGLLSSAVYFLRQLVEAPTAIRADEAVS
jgi:TRAP-type C4-dicarboxylate transport system permease small subunit